MNEFRDNNPINEFVRENDFMMEWEIMENTGGYAFDEVERKFEESLNNLISEQMDYESSFIEEAYLGIEKSKEIDYQIIGWEADFSGDTLNHHLFAEGSEESEFEQYVSEHQLFMEYEDYQITGGYAFDEEELKFEESLNNLIEEQTFYENRFLEFSSADIEKSEEIDYQIESHEVDESDFYSDYEDFFDYEFDEKYYDYDFEDEYWCDEVDMDGAYVDGELQGYIINDDRFDSLDGSSFENYWS